MPQITVRTDSAATAIADVVVIPLHNPSEISDILPSAASRIVKAHARKVSFNGSAGSYEVLIAPRGIKATFIALIGIGPIEASRDEQSEALRRGIASVVQDTRQHLATSIAMYIPEKNLVSAAIEGALLVDYRFTAYRKKLKKEQNSRGLKKLTVLTEPEDAADVRRIIRESKQVMDGVHLARDLVNQPASHMSPRVLVETAQQIAEENPDISSTIFNREQAQRRGFTAFLAVARGSKEEPYVIHLVYKPVGETKKKIALVGKGVTFDSGGLSLKPAQPMEQMKIDMAGAATVLGVFAAVAKQKPSVEVHGIIAACENMPSGEAYRPGDVVTAKNGTTIEIMNTDAEGRVTLADALTYAEEIGPDAIIDLATLTGAAVVALGETHSGLWGTDEELTAGLMSAASISGEALVELPLPSEYEQTIESKVADVRNTATTNYGGAITAALFLRHFVKDTPWAHLDIAGPAFMERPLLPYYPFGATGFGVRTLLEFLKTQ